MSVGFVAAAAIGTVGTMYASNKADKANARGVAAGMQAAEMERQTALDTLNYYRERDSQSFALQRQANAIAGRVAKSQVALMDQQKQQSGEYFDRLKSVFWPVENQLVQDSQEYDTQARRDGEAAEAVAEVGMQADVATAANERQMMRQGVNPAAARFQAMKNQTALGTATAKAGAANNARDRVEQQGWARRLDVTALGKGLPGFSSNAAQVSVGAGNAAVNAAYAPVNAFNGATDRMGGALQNYGNSMTNSFDRMAGIHNNQASMWGQAAGGFANLAGNFAGMAIANRGGSGAGGGPGAGGGSDAGLPPSGSGGMSTAPTINKTYW